MAKNEVSGSAEKIAAAEKKKEKKANPNGNWFVRAGKAIKKFFKDMKGENKKIVWPDAKTVLKSTLVVLVAVVVCALAIYAVDQLLSLAISGLKQAAQAIADKGADAETTTTAAAIYLRGFLLG